MKNSEVLRIFQIICLTFKISIMAVTQNKIVTNVLSEVKAKIYTENYNVIANRTVVAISCETTIFQIESLILKGR